MVDDLGELAAGYTAGAEVEFYLLDGTRPIDQAGYFNEADSAGISLVREAADQLSAFGVDVDGCHLESGPGQYELDLAPHAPVALADALVLAKRVILVEGPSDELVVQRAYRDAHNGRLPIQDGVDVMSMV